MTSFLDPGSSMTWLVTSASAQEAAPPAPAAPQPEPAAPAADAHAPSPDTTHSEVGHAEGHKGPFPPFDTNTFPSQILWFVICFGALYLLMKRVIVPRMAAIIDGRAQRIAGDIEEAQRLKLQSDTALQGYEKALADARGSAHKIAQTATDQAKADAEARRHAIEADLAAKLADAEAKIVATKTEAMSHVEAIAADAAGAIVSHLTGTAPAPADAAKAVKTALGG